MYPNIPIVCEYFIFVVSVEMRGKIKAGSNEKNNCKPDHKRSELLCHWLVKDKSKSFLIFKIN
jgi:hypothetical protein